MDSSDKQAFADCMQGLASSYRREIDKPFLQMMFVALADLSIQQVQAASIAAMRTEQFMPTAAKLRELCGGTGNVHLAWMALLKAIDKFDYYYSVDFEDKAINACVRALGGWEELCSMPASEFDRFVLPKFERLYASFSGRNLGEQGARLIGHTERQNLANGYSTESSPNSYNGAPIAIGADYAIGIEHQPETFGLEFKVPE